MALRHSHARLFLLAPALLSLGCERAPSVDILGSFFPIWIFCILIGIALAAIAGKVFRRTGIEKDIGPVLLIYPSFAALCAFLTWLIFFR